MKKLVIGVLIATLFSACAVKAVQKTNVSVDVDPLTTEGVLSLMHTTSKWQIDNLPHVMVLPSGIIEPLTTHNWVRATFLSGMMGYYDLTKDKDIFDYVNELCKGVDYKLGDRYRHADEFAIGRVYTDIYLVNQDKEVIADMVNRIDDIIEHPTRGPVVGWNGEENWAWCDALFMAPPAWVKLYTCTGKRKYLNEMDIRFWDTYNSLYSHEDSLFFRDARFLLDENGDGLKSEHGQKIFWGRGNGWVIGGLTDILTYIPGDYKHREKYTQLFEEMIVKTARLQAEDGMWRSSMLDYEQYPIKEFSASAFFCYGMAWGINHRILDKDIYWPKVKKAWEAMADCVHEDGKIGYVQRVGADPQSVKSDDTMEYGAGAFLLAGKEIYEILEREKTE